jgi:hypothetical protein
MPPRKVPISFKVQIKAAEFPMPFSPKYEGNQNKMP